METVLDYERLSAAITACFRPGVETNCVLKAEELRRETDAGNLLMHPWAGGLLLLRRRPTHHILSYYLTDPTCPPDIALPKNTVVELPLRPGRQANLHFWEELGFRLLLKRVRLARPALTPGQDAPMTLEIPPITAAEAHGLLLRCFSPLTGCLPSLEELEEDLCCNRILVSGGEGLLRFSDGRIAEIRHLAVAEESRGKGVARALVERFNTRTADRKALVWTGEDNQAALRLYEGAGFVPDGWRSVVLIANETETTEG